MVASVKWKNVKQKTFNVACNAASSIKGQDKQYQV